MSIAFIGARYQTNRIRRPGRILRPDRAASILPCVSKPPHVPAKFVCPAGVTRCNPVGQMRPHGSKFVLVNSKRSAAFRQDLYIFRVSVGQVEHSRGRREAGDRTGRHARVCVGLNGCDATACCTSATSICNTNSPHELDGRLALPFAFCGSEYRISCTSCRNIRSIGQRLEYY